jgi:hypothetical protein
MSEQLPNNEVPTTVDNIDKDAFQGDISKIKIRKIISQRLRNSSPFLKKVLPFILVALIGFAAGLGTDRLFTRGKFSKNFNNRPNIQRKFKYNQDNNQNNKQNNKNFRNDKPGA